MLLINFIGTQPYALGLHTPLFLVNEQHRNSFTCYYSNYYIVICSEYGIYSTRISVGSNGSPSCEIRQRNSEVRMIDQLSGDDRVKFIFSPGINLQPPLE